MAEIKSSSSSSRASTPDFGQDSEAQAHPILSKNNDELANLQGKEVDQAVTGASSLESSIDSLLQKQRNELMFELRRLQHGDRPVTGQGNKEAVEQFFERAIHGEPQTEIGARNRPEQVVVEVDALVQRRPVSSVLRSAGFRRSLENALRSSLSTVSRRPARSLQSLGQRSQPTAVANGSLQVSSGETIANTQEISEQNTTSQRSNMNSVEQRTVPPPPPVEVLARGDHLPLPNQTSRVRNAEAWLQQHPQNVIQSNQSELNIWDNIEEEHREIMIEDISQLVQRQLVTGTLEGNFRNTLENRMRDRLRNTGTDGRRVQQYIQSIPRTRFHVRNDFSDLGIIPPGDQQAEIQSDEMSVISATAAVSVPYAQSNAAMSREINSLKAQMKEMMNMMKVNFDLTMDIQRSIRQEVSAAVNAAPSGSATQTESRQIHSRPVNDTTCLICTEKMVDTVLYQCGHMCVCNTCGIHLRQRGSNCPVCRAPIRDIIRAYKCNID